MKEGAKNSLSVSEGIMEGAEESPPKPPAERLTEEQEAGVCALLNGKCCASKAFVLCAFTYSEMLCVNVCMLLLIP